MGRSQINLGPGAGASWRWGQGTRGGVPWSVHGLGESRRIALRVFSVTCTAAGLCLRLHRIYF